MKFTILLRKINDVGWSDTYEYFSFLCHCRYNYTTGFYRTSADFKKHIKCEQKIISPSNVGKFFFIFYFFLTF